jgi:hypothetical protein
MTAAETEVEVDTSAATSPALELHIGMKEAAEWHRERNLS